MVWVLIVISGITTNAQASSQEIDTIKARQLNFRETQVGLNWSTSYGIRSQVSVINFISLGDNRFFIPIKVSYLMPLKKFDFDNNEIWAKVGLGMCGDSLRSIIWYPIQHRQIGMHKTTHIVPVSFYFRNKLSETDRLIFEFGLSGYDSGAEFSVRFTYTFIRL